MLPILRIIPVGGVFLAIMILVLALNPPGGPHSSSPKATVSARGALIQLDEHPEWRQFLIRAATRRADELNRLRNLPDMPARGDGTQDAGKFAGLPADRSDADPEDETGTIADIPAVTMPIEIGETSSTELPVIRPEEKPPIIKSPERVRVPRDSRTKPAHRARHGRSRSVTPAKPPAAGQFNLFEAIFGGVQAKPAGAGNKQVSQPAPVSPASAAAPVTQ